MRELRVRLKDQVEGILEMDKVKRMESLIITPGQAHGAACMDLEAPEAFLLLLETSLEEEEVDLLVEVDPYLEGDQFQAEEVEEEQVPERPSQYFESIF